MEEDVLKIYLDQVDQLSLNGGAIKLNINMPGGQVKKLLIVREAKASYKIFENSCTHGGQEIEYLEGENIIRCVSFGHSKYNMKGEVIKGPAKIALKQYPAAVSNHLLTVKLD